MCQASTNEIESLPVLETGTRIGHYEILAPLGAGGMGEVYRARDTRLERSVAIKSMPASFASDPERRARFEREAKLLASLNHPNIAGIYGLEDSEGSPYLALELVEGETLAHRLARGPLSTKETLDVGVQIAAAIEVAHERSIVHRDLKPGNVMLTTSGTVKVLDFGLAKGDAAASGSTPQLSATPTVAVGVTGDGIILGTAPYMSPEQARGLGADRRADVWAFGCVIYECLTARQTFAGETVSDVIARILERDPDWSSMPASAPVRLRDLVRRCLTKNPAERPRDIGDLRRELASIAMDSSSSGVGAAASRPSLAVLYFENLAHDEQSEYFCAGITEDILTDLSKIKGLRVASRNAVARYRGAPADIPKVAAELSVGAVLEGSVRRAGDRVRITAQLINTSDGFHLWAERYDRTLEDVFAVQAEIASSIAAALRVALTPAESENLVKDRPKDVKAYDLYLKGRELYGRYTEDALRQALALFEQAIEIDPGYALAWAGIGDSYAQLCQWGSGVDTEELKQLGLVAARRAVELNPQLPEAHKAEALVLRFLGDTDGARRALARALETNPRFLPALINLAVDAFCRADLAGAERLVRRALEADPRDAFATTWLIILTSYTDRADDAMALTHRLRQLSSELLYVTASYGFRTWIHLGRGDVAAAEQTVREGRDDGADHENMRAAEALISVRRGGPDEARAVVSELQAVMKLGNSALAMVIEAAVGVGDLDRAARFLERQIVRELAPTMVRLSRRLHPLLDREPFGPRRSEHTLVWPLEAPMMSAACHALFKEVRIESGLPSGSDVRPPE